MKRILISIALSIGFQIALPADQKDSDDYGRFCVINTTNTTIGAQIIDSFEAPSAKHTVCKSKKVQIHPLCKHAFDDMAYTHRYDTSKIENKKIKLHTIHVDAGERRLSFSTADSLYETSCIVTNPTADTVSYLLIKQPYWTLRNWDCWGTYNYFTVMYIKNECENEVSVYPEVALNRGKNAAVAYRVPTIDSFTLQPGEVKGFHYLSHSESDIGDNRMRVINLQLKKASAFCIMKNGAEIHTLNNVTLATESGPYTKTYQYVLKPNAPRALVLARIGTE